MAACGQYIFGAGLAFCILVSSDAAASDSLLGRWCWRVPIDQNRTATAVVTIVDLGADRYIMRWDDQHFADLRRVDKRRFDHIDDDLDQFYRIASVTGDLEMHDHLGLIGIADRLPATGDTDCNRPSSVSDLS